MISVLLNLLRSGLSWDTFQGQSKRMYILLVLGEVFYKCQVDPVGWWCSWVFLYPCWFSVDRVLAIVQGGMMKPPAVIMDFPSFPFSCVFFLLHIFYGSVVWLHAHLGLLGLLCGLTFYYYIISLPISGNFLCSDINIILI